MKPKCLRCQHFYVTWDTFNSPSYACKFFGFKGKKMPSETVREISGHECPVFEEKEHFRKKNTSK